MLTLEKQELGIRGRLGLIPAIMHMSMGFCEDNFYLLPIHTSRSIHAHATPEHHWMGIIENKSLK